MHLSIHALVMEDGAGEAGRGTSLMLRLSAARSMVKVGRVTVPAVSSSERVSVLMAFAVSEAGRQSWKKWLWEHSQNKRPQSWRSQAKIMRMPVSGAATFGERW